MTDSATNENEGTIYLQKGASLTISGTGQLNLFPRKNMAINGTEGTSLIVNDEANIIIGSTLSTTGEYIFENQLLLMMQQLVMLLKKELIMQLIQKVT